MDEAGLLVAVSYCYETLRNLTTGSAATAFRNAKTITSIEQWLGIYHERAFQHWFLDVPALVAFWNFYYDTAHFVLPIFVAIYLYGWRRMRPWPHFWAGVPVTLAGIGGTASVDLTAQIEVT